LLDAGTVVHVLDPSWVDRELDPLVNPGDEEGDDLNALDADYWALATGGLGNDLLADDYSLLDLEVLFPKNASDLSVGLTALPLTEVLETTCTIEINEVALGSDERLKVTVERDSETFQSFLHPDVLGSDS
jgi:hypothetical protein